MLSKLPINLEKVNKEDIKKVFIDIAKEEKTHIGEFEALLLKIIKSKGKSISCILKTTLLKEEEPVFSLRLHL